MRFIGKFFLYLFVAVFSFFLFLYLSFPYQILKERVVNIISKETASLVSIKTLNPSFPLGLEMEELKIYRPGAGELEVRHVSAQVSLIGVLLGKVNVSVHVKDSGSGTLDVNAQMGIGDVISPKDVLLPSYVSLDASSYDIAPVINYFLSLKASEKNLNPVVKSAFRDMVFVGKLKSNTFFEFDTKDYLNSKGSINITLENAGLDVLALPFQQFEEAHVFASLDKGAFQIDPKTRFISDGLKLESSGSIKQAEDLLDSKLDVTIKLELYKALKESFGMILSFLSPGAADGSMRLRLKGQLGNPQTDFF